MREGLEALGVPYEIDDGLVRGLDYYTMTVFEAKSGALGAQDTVGAGGRYNALISDLGGPDLGGIGFGSGVERMLLAAASRETTSRLDVFFVTLAPEARIPAIELAGALREEGISADLDYGGRGMRAQFKQADRTGASYAVVLGEDELAQGVCTLRDMASGEERSGARRRRGEGPDPGRLRLSVGGPTSRSTARWRTSQLVSRIQGGRA